jgi:hypothetical protein
VNSKSSKKWERSCIGNIKVQLAVVKEALWLLDQAQERRALSHLETDFRTRLKETYLGLLTIEQIKARQRARLTNIKYGDANTKLFFANGRKRKKHIHVLQTDDGLATKLEDKAKGIERHFDKMLGTK